MSLECDERRGLHWAAALVSSCLVLACQSPPKQAALPTQTAPGSAPAAVEPVVPAEPQVIAPQAIQRTFFAAIEQLEQGQEEQAEVLLRQVLQQEPNHRQAQQLLRQIKEDPNSLLGRESFVYRVQAGETLSRIAQRFLNDTLLFYALARYNGIKVPRQLAGGQLIRVPGKQATPAPGGPAPAVAAPAPTPAPAVAATPVPAASVPAPVAAPPDPAAAANRAAREKADAIARYSREARGAFAKQDLEAAIRAWDKVLALDPNYRTALLERQKALDLSERLKKVR
jgi:tetratricopeptide (TPR) repeat protein